jgi:tetratricopeptide (TPR) repeat protein
MEKFDKAIEDYTNELRFGPPNNIKAFNNRAYCFAKLRSYQEAIKDYGKVI